MKKKFLACGLAACAALVALALPTKKEVQAARPIVAELMADAVAEQKAGKINTAELGARALALADRAETEAARLLLLQGAVIAFARGGEPARAAEAVRKMRGEIKGITPEYEADMLSRAVKSLPLKDGRLLYGMLDDARRLVRYRREAATLEKSLAAKDDPAKRAQLAERLAALGEWKRALEEIAKLGGDVARAAKFELGEGTMTSAEVAEFWWRQSGMKDADGFTVYQRHAGEWYAKALADGSLTGLKRDLAQKRIDDMGGIKNFRGSGTVASGTRAASGHRESGVPAASEKQSNALYCVIDLSTGPSASRYPVKWLATPPPGGFNTDEYKTSKLVLRRIEPGTFKMGGKQIPVTLTKPYYIGIFQMTQKQYELVAGDNPASYKGDMRPVEMVSYDMLRGKDDGAKWPASSAVDAASFIGKLRARTGIDGLDLPTEAQWEFACRAGTTSRYNNGGDSNVDLKRLGRFVLNQKCRNVRESAESFAQHEPDGKGGCSERHTAVGSYLPNAWGLYDMHGNVWERCLDWRADDRPSSGTDPVGSSSGTKRVIRGGSWDAHPLGCTSSFQNGFEPSSGANTLGFRLAIGHDLLKERSSDTKVIVPALSEEKLPKETSARPKPLVLDLGGGVKMEMVGCPAGTFTRKLYERTFRQEISRPFYIGKYPVTIEQWERLMPTVTPPSGTTRAKLDPRIPVQVYPGGTMGLTRKSLDILLDLLMRKFRRQLPSGYVFRLPTQGEWLYALSAQSSDPNDPYVNKKATEEQMSAIAVMAKDSKAYWQNQGVPLRLLDQASRMLYIPVGQRKPNAWGIFDMAGGTCQLLLDSYLATTKDLQEEFASKKTRYIIQRNESEFGDGSKDPLIFEMPDRPDAERRVFANLGDSYLTPYDWRWHPSMGKRTFPYRFEEQTKFSLMLRLVVGPDLLKERGITPPKLGK